MDRFEICSVIWAKKVDFLAKKSGFFGQKFEMDRFEICGRKTAKKVGFLAKNSKWIDLKFALYFAV